MPRMSAGCQDAPGVLRFAGWELDAAGMQLRRAGTSVDVQPLVLELILW